MYTQDETVKCIFSQCGSTITTIPQSNTSKLTHVTNDDDTPPHSIGTVDKMAPLEIV